MQITLRYGHAQLECEIRNEGLIRVQRGALVQPLHDPAAGLRAALETPIGFPPLRRALTPDDHVTVVVDEHLPHAAELVIPVLEHLSQAQVSPSAVTLLWPRSDYRQEWLGDLPEQFQNVHCQVHAPGDRKQLSYLATTKGGRRLYLNRNVVDADQVVVLSGRGYDPRLGYSGAEGSLFPALSDEATLGDTNDRLSLAAPGATPWPLRREAEEAAWLLGAPFFVQVIPGEGDTISQIIGGVADSCREGQRLLDALWRQSVAEPADMVIATVSGEPAQQGFRDLAAALANAARVVKTDGRIILLSAIAPRLGTAEEVLRQADTPDEALALLHKHKPPDMAAAFQWAHAARHARIYLLSGLPSETAEELFVTPLEHGNHMGRLLEQTGTYLVLNDAHKTMAVVG